MDDPCTKFGRMTKGMIVGRQGGRCTLCRHPIQASNCEIHCILMHAHKDCKGENQFALHHECHEKTLCGKP